jgi:hypothetical protein
MRLPRSPEKEEPEIMPKSHNRRAAEDEPGVDPAIAGQTGPPYTVFFPIDGTLHPADLEHPSSLPRAGDTVEYIDEHGACHRFEVAEVIHTLQMAADRRPRVGDEAIPNAFARGDGKPAERPGDGGLLRAGLPKVILREARSTEPTREEGGFTVRRTDDGSQEAAVREQMRTAAKPRRSRATARSAGNG